MATIISGLKVNHQMYKCFNCGRKAVSLGNDYFELKNRESYPFEDDELNEKDVFSDSAEFNEFNDEWQATCHHCGWSDT